MRRILAFIALFLFISGHCLEVLHRHASSHDDCHQVCCHSCGGHHVAVKAEPAELPPAPLHTLRLSAEPFVPVFLAEDIFHPPAA